jgi:hypothetical protein
MRILSPALFSRIFFVALPAKAQSAQPSTAQTSASASTIEQELVSVVHARTNAFASEDCQTFATFIDNDFRNIEGAHTATRKEILEECQQEARPLPGRKIERLVSDFHVQLVGNIALVDYVDEFREQYGEVVLNLASHNVDTCEKRQGKWVALLAVSAAIIPDPPVAKIDTANFADLIGEYAWVGARNVERVGISKRGWALHSGHRGGHAHRTVPGKGGHVFRARRGCWPAGPSGLCQRPDRSSGLGASLFTREWTGI